MAGLPGHPRDGRRDDVGGRDDGSRRTAVPGNRGDEAQRDQRQSGRALPGEAGRARHRLGQGQDLGPRRQGPDRAHRRRAQRLRRRADAAASAAAEARLQQHLPQRASRWSISAGCSRRSMPGKLSATRARSTAPELVAAGVLRRAGRRHPAAGQGRAHARRSRSRSPAPPRRRSPRSRRRAARSCCRGAAGRTRESRRPDLAVIGRQP